jgi:hypothetical protein
MIRHPYQEKAELVWEDHAPVAFQAYTQKRVNYRSANKYTIRNLFASIILVGEDNAFLESAGYVVTRTCFDEIRVFDTLRVAKIYVESLFALETID